MSGHLESIVALQRTLNNLSTAEERLNGIPDWMRELHAEHQQRKSEIEAVEAIAEEAASQRRESEGAIADAQEKLKHYQAQVGQISTQREYGALLKEIDTVKQEVSSGEQVVIESMERLETAEQDRDRLREEFRDLDDRYKRELTKWEGEKPAVAKTVATLQARAISLREDVPRNVQTLFDRLVQRTDAQALARVAKVTTMRKSLNASWHCTDCHYQVRPQVVVEIRNLGALVQCESCKRILYIDDGEESDSSS